MLNAFLNNKRTMKNKYCNWARSMSFACIRFVGALFRCSCDAGTYHGLPMAVHRTRDHDRSSKTFMSSLLRAERPWIPTKLLADANGKPFGRIKATRVPLWTHTSPTTRIRNA